MPSKTSPTKPYFFDRYFEADAAAHYDAAHGKCSATGGKAVKPKRVYDEKDLAQARAEARQLALSEFENTEQKRLADACNAIAGALKNAEDIFAENKNDLTNQCIILARILMKKLILDSESADKVIEIESFLMQILPHIFDQTRIIVKVAEDIAPQLHQTIESLVRASGLSGEINVVADRNVIGSDCIVEWPGGGASRNQRDTWQKLNALIDNMTGQTVDVLDEPPAPSSAEDRTAPFTGST